MTVKSALTDYGFQFGPAKVERMAEHNGHVMLSIDTPAQRLHIRVTPSGLIRIDETQTKKRKQS